VLFRSRHIKAALLQTSLKSSHQGFTSKQLEK